MAELNINERQVGEVTILDLDGKITIGEGSVALRTTIRRLLDENKKNIVLNYAGVGYQDSSGNGEIVSSYTAVYRVGGRMCIANLTQKLQDLLTITKLLTVFDAFDSEDEAVKHLTSKKRSISCPVRGCENLVRISEPEVACVEVCPKCLTRLFLEPSLVGDQQVRISFMRLPTYDDEYISVTIRQPTTIGIVGRLDLFASEVLEKAWQSLLPPRRVMFDLTDCREISEAGVQRLRMLCANREERSIAVILTRSEAQQSTFPLGALVYREEREAVAALGNIPRNNEWTLDVRTQPDR